MRPILLLSSFLLLTRLAIGQVSLVSGYAGYWAAPPGEYAAPFIPLLHTPSASLDNPYLVAPSYPAVPASQPAIELAPRYYGPGEPSQNEVPSAAESSEGHFRLGVAQFQSSVGLAQLAALSRKGAPAAHVYTNEDIAKLNQDTGLVSYGNKTEHLD